MYTVYPVVTGSNLYIGWILQFLSLYNHRSTYETNEESHIQFNGQQYWRWLELWHEHLITKQWNFWSSLATPTHCITHYLTLGSKRRKSISNNADFLHNMQHASPWDTVVHTWTEVSLTLLYTNVFWSQLSKSPAKTKSWNSTMIPSTPSNLQENDSDGKELSCCNGQVKVQTSTWLKCCGRTIKKLC